MPNELVLLISLIVSFGGVLLFFRLFGKAGLYVWTSIATITANIEVLIMIHAFGMEMTLGNIIFAVTFAATDILSECYGKKTASRAVWIGVATNLAFVLLSQLWFLYTPSTEDWVMESVTTIFSNTPRLMLASIIAYIVSERFDVWAYHAIWHFTEKKSGSSKKYLWLRNNGSTLVSQLINAILFNVIAFVGMYEFNLLVSVCVSTYVIYIATSLLDTPFVYAARFIYNKWMKSDDALSE